MWLVCSARCGGKIFRALSAEVDVNSSGEYEGHRVTQAVFQCLACGAPALDLSAVPAEMAAEAEEDEPEPLLDILCPICETPVSVSPEAECPNCGSPLNIL